MSRRQQPREHPPMTISYCGDQEPSTGRRRGTPLECFKKGIRTGFKLGIDKGLAQGRTRSSLMGQIRRTPSTTTSTTSTQTHPQPKTDKISSALIRRQIVNDIQTKGLKTLKHELHVGTLLKDEARSIYSHLDPTARPILGRHYTSASRDELVQGLLTIGFHL